MALQIRRGLNSERITKVLQNGEIAWTTDTKKLYIGDGVTTGGTNILQSAQGVGLSWNPVTEQLDLTASTLFINSSNVTETTNLFHTAQRAQDAAAALFTNAAGDHVGISFVYDSVNHKLTATVAQENIEDKVGAVLVAGNATNTGITFTYDATADSNNRVNAAVDIEYLQDQVAAFFAAGTHVGITYTYEDNNNKINSTVNLLGSLAGNLSLNGNNINGTGNIDILGSISSTSIATNSINPIVGSTTVVATAKQLRTLYASTGAMANIGDSPSIEIASSRGTLASPTSLQENDFGGGFTVTGNVNGTDRLLSTLITQITNNNGFGTNNKPVRIAVLALNTTGTYESFAFDSSGILNTKALQSRGMSQSDITNLPALAYGASPASATGTIVYNTTNNRLQMYITNAWKNIQHDGTPVTTGSYNGSGNYPTGTAGMIIFDSSNNNFYGFDGSIWKQLNN